MDGKDAQDKKKPYTEWGEEVMPRERMHLPHLPTLCFRLYVALNKESLISWSLQIKQTCGFMMRIGRFKSILTNQSSNKAQTTIFNNTYVPKLRMEKYTWMCNF